MLYWSSSAAGPQQVVSITPTLVKKYFQGLEKVLDKTGGIWYNSRIKIEEGF